MKKKLLFFIVLSFSSTLMFSQKSTVSSGGNATGTSGTSSFTVGQAFYSATQNTNGSVIEGMQQAFEIQVLINPEVEGVQLGISTYPNPTTDKLTLSIDPVKFTNISFHMHDIRGKLIINTTMVTSNNTTIEMGVFAKGSYILTVKRQKRNLKTFKIIKN